MGTNSSLKWWEENKELLKNEVVKRCREIEGFTMPEQDLLDMLMELMSWYRGRSQGFQVRANKKLWQKVEHILKRYSVVHVVIDWNKEFVTKAYSHTAKIGDPVPRIKKFDKIIKCEKEV